MNFAIIETGGKQYKVKEGDIVKINKLEPADQKKVVFDKILLLVKDDEEVKIGQPYLNGVKAEADILEQGRSKKITIIKYKPKTRYRRKRGFHFLYTKVKISKIIF